MAGIYRADTIGRKQQRQEFVDNILATFPVIPFDITVARTHAELWATMETSGQRIGSLDMIIAATAINLGFGILTLNARDFSRVPGLNVIQPTV
jgi:predicted nucleic acid-binding protein